MRYYGLVNEKEAYIIVDEICKHLGFGANRTADIMLIETARAETNLGLTKDRSIISQGVGLTQIDKIAFDDIKTRSMKHNEKIKENLKTDLSVVTYEMLAYSPFLAFLFTRLKYKLIPEEIPTTIEERAKYWKKYYNTSAGAGTIYHYLEANKGF